ncbi:fasciclin domain-containing protein [Aquimarina muelleri]|uniref:FAS1 domain-containing protein n=1 Tax=Aquimarina muelleri TaxID=279356 RepID=A0A918JUS9_9FLAO|nr:fasciclin domain-containing protein [Aquimarina muelleri]MCX2762167.1 fasciclin domain-containing protein [Aquimarina muelleri]GGX16861.1 hypothetical protein GCM10007384_18020 [Aquimarina muelleri]
MRIKNNISVLFLSGLLVVTACSETKKEGKEIKGNEKLIAENIIQPQKIEKNKPTIIEFTAMDKGFSILASVIEVAEFSKVLNTENSYTIFAPVNMAFDKLPEGKVEELLESRNKEKLQSILNYHVIPGKITKEDITAAVKEGRGSMQLKTLGGSKLTVSMKKNRIFIIDKMGNGGTLVTTDVEASNGIIHTIDAVMTSEK